MKEPVIKKQRVVLAGGSGFIGGVLAADFLQRDCEVVVLTRSPRARADGVREVEWNGEHVGEWIQHLDGAAAVVNLAGRSVNCPHTADNIREIRQSRVNSVRAVALALDHLKEPPPVWVQAGAVGFYGPHHEEWCEENMPAGGDELAKVCQDWEDAFNSLRTPKTRRVLLRIGFVLGRDGGALPVLAKLTRWFMGGAVGNGRQFISWIHPTDLTRMFREAIRRDDLTGTYNASGQSPATNAEFMRELRRTLHRPWSPPVPAWAVRIGCRWMETEASLALAGCRCAPKRLLEAGFRFEFPELRGALKDIYRKRVVISTHRP